MKAPEEMEATIYGIALDDPHLSGYNTLFLVKVALQFTRIDESKLCQTLLFLLILDDLVNVCSSRDEATCGKKGHDQGEVDVNRLRTF